jgi:hypothetical protein
MVVVSGLGGANDLAHHSPTTRHTMMRIVVFPTIRENARRKCPSVVKYRTVDAFARVKGRSQ